MKELHNSSFLFGHHYLVLFEAVINGEYGDEEKILFQIENNKNLNTPIIVNSEMTFLNLSVLDHFIGPFQLGRIFSILINVSRFKRNEVN